jgi:hypothetical protein
VEFLVHKRHTVSGVEVQAVDPKPAGSHDGRDGPARHDGRTESDVDRTKPKRLIISHLVDDNGVGLSTIPPSRQTFRWRSGQDNA